MTASITPCWKRNLAREISLNARRLLAPLLALLLPVLSSSAYADGASIKYAEIVPQGANYVINADIALALNPRVTEAIERGIPVQFVAEVTIKAPRWYWLDKTAASETLIYRLSYHPLTRSYRLTAGGLHQSFDNLEAAVATVQRIRSWPVAPVDQLATGTSYNVALRFYLDTDHLPRPFLVSDVGSGDWSINTDWTRWTFLAGPLATP